MNINKIQKVADDIKTITIQGATNIAREGIKIISTEILQPCKTIKELDQFFAKAKKILTQARATEPMLFNGLRYIDSVYQSSKNKKIALHQIQKNISKAAEQYISWIEHEEKVRPALGAKLIKKNSNIMTHCHSSSVVKTLVTAHQQKKNIHVYNTETRPLYQGRKTSLDLLKAGVPDTMITDDSGPFFIDNLYESDINIDMLIVGSDAIKLHGDVYNKIGSFSLSLSAYHSKIPVYVVGSLLKIDTNNSVGIETRSGKELRPEAPKKLDIVNYAFDMIPAKFITGIITEFGVIKPSQLKQAIKKHYPWLLS